MSDDTTKQAGELGKYHLVQAAREDLCRRLGRKAEARVSYERALALTRQEPEWRFLELRMCQPLLFYLGRVVFLRRQRLATYAASRISQPSSFICAELSA